MVMAGLIFMVFTWLFFFYFPAVSKKIFRRQFTQDFVQFLESPSVRKDIGIFGDLADYPRLALRLKHDSLVLTYLRENDTNFNQRSSFEKRLLILNFKLVMLSLLMRDWTRLGKRRPPST
jgi:hypothetical protein